MSLPVVTLPIRGGTTIEPKKSDAKVTNVNH